MSRRKKTLDKVLNAAQENSIRFSDLRSLLEALGFTETIKGSHHVFRKPGVAAKINLQPQSGKAKGYQVRQVRKAIIDYNLDKE